MVTYSAQRVELGPVAQTVDEEVPKGAGVLGLAWFPATQPQTGVHISECTVRKFYGLQKFG